MVFKPSNTLLLPGWQTSGPGHWQSLWQARHGYRRVEQHDWLRPLRGDWTARLGETLVYSDSPLLLVPHTPPCIRADRPAQAPPGTPIARQALPFPALLVASRNDPYCSWARAEGLAQSWGARFIDLG